MALKNETKKGVGDEATEATEALTGEETSKTKPKSNVNVLVMDSGRSWVICVALFVILTLGSTFGRATAMTFMDFVNKYDVSITTTSLSFTFYLVSISIASLLATSMVQKMGPRVSAIIGCIGGAICTIGVGMAPNVGVFLVSMTLKGGLLLRGLFYTFNIIDKSVLATALANCGIGVGSMGSPPIIEFLLERYGLEGAYLIIAAAEMNCIAAAILLRPTSRYKTIIRNGPNQKIKQLENKDAELGSSANNNTDTQQNAMETSSPGPYSSTNGKGFKESAIPIRVQQASGCSRYANSTEEVNVKLMATSSEDVDEQHGYLLPGQNKPRIRSASETDHTVDLLRNGVGNIRNDGSFPFYCRQISDSGRLEGGMGTNLVPEYHSETHKGGTRFNGVSATSHTKSPGGDKCLEEVSNLPPFSKDIMSKSLQPLNHNSDLIHRNVKCEQVREKPYAQLLARGISNAVTSWTNEGHKSTLSLRSSTWSIVSHPIGDMAIDTELFAQETERRSITNPPEKNGTEHHLDTANAKKEMRQNLCTKTLAALHNTFSVRLLRLWTMRFLLLSTVTGTLAQYILAYLPTIALKQSITPDGVSLLLTVSGAVDLVSRIATGFFTDLHILTPSQIVAITQSCIALACFFNKFYTSFNMLMFLSVITGLFGGTRQSLSTLLTIDFMGIHVFLQALGLQAMTGILSLAIHHPMLSSVVEATGSFSPPLYYVGVALCISSIFLLLAPVAKRLDKAKSSTT